jgi:hypothetical protein
MTINITPELGIPIPTTFEPREYPDILQRAKAAFRTRKFLIRNGLVELDPSNPEDRPFIEAAARESAKQFTGSPVAKRRPFNAETAKWLDELLFKYSNNIIEDATRLKTYVTTRLIEESDGEKASDRLNALEKLGKLSQLGMFADKVEISVTHRTTDQLKEELNKKLSRYMGVAEEVKPSAGKKREAMVLDLDMELSVITSKEDKNGG